MPSLPAADALPLWGSIVLIVIGVLVLAGAKWFADHGGTSGDPWVLGWLYGAGAGNSPGDWVLRLFGGIVMGVLLILLGVWGLGE